MPDTPENTTYLMPLLAPSDPTPVRTYNAEGRAPMLLLCDHASNRVPERLGNLGLDPAELRRHIGWDIGAGALTMSLADQLGAPALLAGFSRLVIDNNRSLDDPTSVPEISDGALVPGNRDISGADRKARTEEIFKPYHAAIDAKIDAMLAAGPPPIILSIHSFTPVMRGEERPWHVSILWKSDPRLPQALLQRLRTVPGICAGDNVPYSAHEGYGHTIESHAEPRGLANALLEVRQDLIDTADGVADWTRTLTAVFTDIATDPSMYEVRLP